MIMKIYKTLKLKQNKLQNQKYLNYVYVMSMVL